MADYVKVKITVDPFEYPLLRGACWDGKRSIFSLDRIYEIEDRYKINPKIDLKYREDSGWTGLPWIDIKEFAIVHYLKTLDSKKCRPIIRQLAKMPNNGIFRSTADKIVYEFTGQGICNRIDEEDALEKISKYLADNPTEFEYSDGTKKLMTTLDDFGAAMLENVLKTGEYDEDKYRMKVHGCQFPIYGAKTNGYDSFYLSTTPH